MVVVTTRRFDLILAMVGNEIWLRDDCVMTDNDNAVDGFVIEYRDSNGRLLSTKEAFRYFSTQFHGKAAGKKNKDKKNKNYARAMASKGVRRK